MTITSLANLSRISATPISAPTEVCIPGCHIEAACNREGDLVPGAKWWLIQTATDIRMRELVIS